jgi:hypothetical protein
MAAIVIYAAVGTLVAAFVALTLFAGVDMKRFLARIPVLRDQDDLEAYQDVVARNMFAAIAMLALAFAFGVILMVAVLVGELSMWEVGSVLLAGVPVTLGSAFWTKSIEKRVAAIPTADNVLAVARDRIVHVWHSKMLPDW